MFTINIENNIMICVLILLLFIVIMYYIKRKFDSIDKYNAEIADKLKTYKECITQYKRNLKDMGLSNKELRVFNKLLKIFKNIKEE